MSGIAAEAVSHVLAIEDAHGAALLEELFLEGKGDGRFARGGEAGEEDGDGLLAEAGLAVGGRDIAVLAGE